MTALSALLLATTLLSSPPSLAQGGPPPLPNPTTSPGEPPPPGDGPPPTEGGSAAPPPTGAEGAPTPDDPGPSAGGTPSPLPSAPPVTTGRTSRDSGGAGLYLGVGAALFLLLGVVWVWSRGREEVDAPLPTALTRLPEPPLLGAPLPSLSDGLQVWTVEDADKNDLLADVLSTLARSHRVLVVCASHIQLPRVAGGPVFRVDGMRPAHLEDPVHLLDEDGGRPVCVLLVPPAGTEAAVPEFADVLPPQVGGVVLSSAAAAIPLPQVKITRTDHGWTLSNDAGSLTVSRDAGGCLTHAGTSAA
mgnify:CR=1 FL=1